jgi:cellulose synthase/poly-beta-1,6-N-acetylglucosamine synthase-like glycosyltransferase
MRPIKHLSLLVPACDEALVIEATIRGLIQSLGDLKPGLDTEILVVDDGSLDETPSILARLRDEFGDHLQTCTRRPNRCREGKAAALNAGLQALVDTFPERNPGEWVLGVFDADAGCDKDLFPQVIALFEERGYDAVQCAVRIENTSAGLLPVLQDIEFLSFAGVMQPVRSSTSGAVMLGGNAQFAMVEPLLKLAQTRNWAWQPDALTEDLELALSLHSGDWRIGFCPAFVHQQGLESIRALMRQRLRWGWGTSQVFAWYFFNWRRYWSSAMPLLRKLDAAYYLCFWMIPSLVLAGWLLTFSSVLTGLTIVNAFQPWFLFLLSFSYLPIFAAGIRRRYQLKSLKTWALLMATVVYTYHWIPAILYGMGSVLLRRKPVWAKTARLHPTETAA